MNIIVRSDRDAAIPVGSALSGRARRCSWGGESAGSVGIAALVAEPHSLARKRLRFSFGHLLLLVEQPQFGPFSLQAWQFGSVIRLHLLIPLKAFGRSGRSRS